MPSNGATGLPGYAENDAEPMPRPGPLPTPEGRSRPEEPATAETRPLAGLHPPAAEQQRRPAWNAAGVPYLLPILRPWPVLRCWPDRRRPPGQSRPDHRQLHRCHHGQRPGGRAGMVAFCHSVTHSRIHALLPLPWGYSARRAHTTLTSLLFGYLRVPVRAQPPRRTPLESSPFPRPWQRAHDPPCHTLRSGQGPSWHPNELYAPNATVALS
jgi:hypothetical protein